MKKPLLKSWLIGLGWSIVFLLFMQWLDYQGWFAAWNGRISNWVLANRSSHPDTSAARDILTVEVDDEAYDKCFNSQSPMNPARVLQLVAQVAQSRPRAIGVDIRTEGSKYQDDRAILDGLTLPIVWVASFDNLTPTPATFGGWLMGKRDHIAVVPRRVLGLSPFSLPKRPQTSWGIPLFPREEDSAIRRFPRSTDVAPNDAQGGYNVPSWAKRVADVYCSPACTSESAEEVYVSYAGLMPRRFKMLDLFTCPGKDELKPGAHAWETFQLVAEGRIVLVGGTFRESNDFYRTPVGELPGLIINAYAIKAELEGNGLEEVKQPWAWLLDLLLAIVILTICDERVLGRDWKRKKILISTGVVLLVCLASLFVAGGRYLLGFAGEGFGVLLDRVRDSWEFSRDEDKDPHPEPESPAS